MTLSGPTPLPTRRLISSVSAVSKKVVRLITQTYDKDGVLMTVEQAADEVENYLVEENYSMASKISKIKKRLQESATTEKTGQTQQTQRMNTLTNASASTRKLSSKERAILAFKGQIGKG